MSRAVYFALQDTSGPVESEYYPGKYEAEDVDPGNILLNTQTCIDQRSSAVIIPHVCLCLFSCCNGQGPYA